jgi:hypothetical protein
MTLQMIEPPFGRSSSTTLHVIFTTVSLLALLAASPPATAAGKESELSPATPIDFDIPSQPLGRALIAFGATARLDLYYNAAFADGRRSATVVGKLTPVVALQRLLQGTGLVPRMTAPEAVILVPATREVVAPRGSVVATSARYGPYFAKIQARISDALCRNIGAGQEGDETFLRVWLTAAGVIEQVEIVGASARRTNSHGLADAVQGLAIGAPPSGMPQPVMLVVFPPSAAQQDCRSSNAPEKAN